MQELFTRTIGDPKTRAVAFQALHTLLHCDPGNPAGIVERIPKTADYSISLFFIDYIFRTLSPDELIIPFLQCLNQRVPSNNEDSSLPSHLSEIQNPLEGDDICKVILDQSSVKAPHGARFYLEVQTNPGQVGTCGLHALRHYVGTQWISLAQLDSIKFQSPASQAALTPATEKIAQTLNSIEIPEGSDLGQKILDGISRLKSEISNISVTEPIAFEIVSDTRNFVSLLADNLAKNLNDPEVKTLIDAAKTIENDVLSVKDGGVDGDVLLAALNLLDDGTRFENPEALGLGNRVDYEEIFQAMDTMPSVDRAIILAGAHFVPIRKNTDGAWHIVDGMIGIVPRERVGNAWGNGDNTVLNGIIYSTQENLGDHLISQLAPQPAPSEPSS
jgi:hypothetical protein